MSLCPPCSGCGEGAKICDESSSAARHFSFRKPGGFTGEGQKSRCETGRKLYPICHCQTPLLSLSLSLLISGCWDLRAQASIAVGKGTGNKSSSMSSSYSHSAFHSALHSWKNVNHENGETYPRCVSIITSLLLLLLLLLLPIRQRE